MTLPLDDDAVRGALSQVDDPEAGMNILDLGLVYRIEILEGAIEVDLTMTTAACPLADMIVDQARAAVESVAGDSARVDIRLVWDPPWTPDRMTDLARERFGWN